MSEQTCTDKILLRGPVPLSHLLLQRYVQPGDRTVDATCGNGNDTLLLAQLVGPNGRVWGFDIQPPALERTARLLKTHNAGHPVTLVEAGHETMADHAIGPVTAVVFNLGYLPGGNRSLVTRTGTTLKALEQALVLLAPGGIIAVTVYPGHAGGADEGNEIEAWGRSLHPGNAHVWRLGQLNATPDAPYLVLVQKVC